MESYIGRQPIFDRNKKAQAYELLFRASHKNHFEEIDGSLATSRVLHNFLLSIGVEEVTGKKKAFINFPKELLIEGLPELLNPSTIVIEILETVEMDRELVEICEALSNKGYTFALDDFEFKEEYAPLLPLIQIVKLDIQKIGIHSVQSHMEMLAPYDLKLLAEKVETEGEFRTTMDMGFEFFQGFFFCEPQVLNCKDINADKWNKLNLLKTLHEPELNIDKLEELISRDVILSYKLLKSVNSVMLGLKVPITSIRHASVLLGQKNLCRWLSLIILGEIGSDKPRELFAASSIRAKFCELLCLSSGAEDLGPELFTIGMFSLLDAIMDRPMDELLKGLHLEKNLSDALLEQKGPLAPFLDLVKAYEQGDWGKILDKTSQLGTELDHISDCYLKAIQWTEDVLLTS